MLSQYSKLETVTERAVVDPVVSSDPYWEISMGFKMTLNLQLQKKLQENFVVLKNA